MFSHGLILPPLFYVILLALPIAVEGLAHTWVLSCWPRADISRGYTLSHSQMKPKSSEMAGFLLFDHAG